MSLSAFKSSLNDALFELNNSRKVGLHFCGSLDDNDERHQDPASGADRPEYWQAYVDYHEGM